MSVQGLLIRFFLIYMSLSTVVSGTLALLGFEGGSVNPAVLLGSVLLACQWFARRNKRYFTPAEKRNAILGMLAVDMAVETAGVVVGTGSSSGIVLRSMLLGGLIVGVLHGALVWFFVGFAGKQFAKEFASRS